jgi:uncharacterized protein Smg (DUF494 family)
MMSEQADKMKKLVAFKKKLENRVDELESELRELQTMLETVNVILLEKGFKHAEIVKAPAMAETLPTKEEAEAKPSYPAPTAEYGNVIPLKTFTGELLANLHLGEDSLRVVLAEDKNFSSDTPPFTQFLIERVLAKMKEKDEELTRSGQLMPDKVFSYNIIQDGEIIREIAIKNVGTDRLRELKSSIRWTLEKMYEKMESQS